ncbi:helix-turn-helix transcriptional regulator [Entomohabitans teleogrylli]|uniref:helix-turn-helix transcriptional regulator n=1 Tax=Entomohabitans teleogrylli TaxID=1384589 RepID=UPI00073D9AC9|nr:response regulator transcription factor [Entomohabitans teleogrylli]
MSVFNSPQLRYKFIYLTSNPYHGVAVEYIHSQTYSNSALQKFLGDGLPLFLTDNLLNVYFFCQIQQLSQDIPGEPRLDKITIQMKNSEFRGKSLDNILFFVDIFNAKNNAFLSLDSIKCITGAERAIRQFLKHCLSSLKNVQDHYNKHLVFSAREQKIGFLLLHGFSTRDIASKLNVSDKSIYRDKELFLKKIQEQSKSYARCPRRTAALNN